MGIGMGAGTYELSSKEQPGEEQPGVDAEDSQPQTPGMGSGGGGGGYTFSRPVALVIASADGVRVEPVLDVTKIALAALTTAGFMLGMMARMVKQPR
jgi:uncharacterized spore protein YtfJ